MARSRIPHRLTLRTAVAAGALLLLSPIAQAQAKFFWGVANSAFQVEGSPVDSDWKRWTETAGKIRDKATAQQGTDFWYRFEEDFALTQSAGLNAFRFSIAWERIEPRPGEWNEEALDHYRKVVQAARARGLEPIVTLHHTVLPGWLADQGGLLAQGFPDHFARYTARTVRALSSGPAGVKWWITLNEPEVLVLAGYTEGIWPPGKRDLKQTTRALDALILAHRQAAHSIRKLGISGLRVGVAKNWQVLQAFNRKHPVDRAAASLAHQQYNLRFLDAVAGKDSKTCDFIGLNYYSRNLIRTKPSFPFLERRWADEGPTTDLGWEIHPQGLGQAIQETWKRWKLPILITENGLADAADAQRSQFLDQHLEQLALARRQGVPLLGYLHWSLTDNFEWAEGLTPRFGLVAIDYATQRRTPRPSYYHYAQRVREWGPEGPH